MGLRKEKAYLVEGTGKVVLEVLFVKVNEIMTYSWRQLEIGTVPDILKINHSRKKTQCKADFEGVRFI